MVSLDEVVTAVTSAMVGAVVSVVDSSFSLQEKITKLKRNRERMMSICLTKFPFGGLGEPYLYQNLVCFTMCVGILLGGCLTVKN